MSLLPVPATEDIQQEELFFFQPAENKGHVCLPPADYLLFTGGARKPRLLSNFSGIPGIAGLLFPGRHRPFQAGSFPACKPWTLDFDQPRPGRHADGG
jgi:hypothetical protein